MATPRVTRIAFDYEKLSALRRERGVSVYKMSIETGVEVAIISRLESGKAMYPSFITVCRLADFLGVSYEQLKRTNPCHSTVTA